MTTSERITGQCRGATLGEASIHCHCTHGHYWIFYSGFSTCKTLSTETAPIRSTPEEGATNANSTHTQTPELHTAYLRSNWSMNTFANILKLQIKYPVVFPLTFNPSSLGISKIISQTWLKELSFTWSGLGCFFPPLSGTCVMPSSSSILGWSHWNGHFLIMWHQMPVSQHFPAFCNFSKSGSYHGNCISLVSVFYLPP